MQTRRFSMAARGATTAMAALCLYAGHGSLAAKPAAKAKAAGGSPVTQGKALVSQFRCNGCHGADLKGRQGFSPNIRKTGALHDYTQAQFVTLLHTGKKNDGSMVHKPMPAYGDKITDAQAKAIFAYLETQK